MEVLTYPFFYLLSYIWCSINKWVRWSVIFIIITTIIINWVTELYEDK